MLDKNTVIVVLGKKNLGIVEDHLWACTGGLFVGEERTVTNDAMGMKLI
jgi:hypothetical protein